MEGLTQVRLKACILTHTLAWTIADLGHGVVVYLHGLHDDIQGLYTQVIREVGPTPKARRAWS